MREALRRVARFAARPSTNLVIAVMLIATAFVEIIESASRVGSHHGIAVYGLVHGLRAAALLVGREIGEVVDDVDRLGG